MSHPTSRTLALLELLQAHQRLTGDELAARLGVDPRTVRRYATRLAELGIPLVAERGRYGGYRLAPGYRLPPLMLTEDEAVAVVLGLVAGQRLGLATAAPAVDIALAKIRRVLPARLADRVGAIVETLSLTWNRRGGEGAGPETGALLGIAEATRSGRRVRLAYRSWRGERTERAFDPYGLVFHSGRWYSVGFDHRRGEVRSFRLDRMGAVEPLPETFEVPAGFDAVGHLTASLARVPWAHRVEVLLHTDPAAARRRIPPSVATLSEVDGGVLLVGHAERLDGMAAMLAGLGFRFTIREPAALRAEVLALADRLQADAGPPQSTTIL
jgi:predicted DNA-binding transcriptional regulator YafY